MVPYISTFFLFQSTVRSIQIRILRLRKEQKNVFNSFRLVLFCLIVPKIKKVFTNMSPAIDIISALRVEYK